MISEQELLEKHIKPHHILLAMGAYDRIEYDPSIVLASTIINAKEGGKITIVDCQYASHWDHTKIGKLLVKKGMKPTEFEKIPGIGDPIAHRAELRKFAKKNNIKIQVPKIRFTTNLSTTFGDRHADIIIDRGTAAYKLFNPLTRLGLPITRETIGKIRALANDYHLLLKPGGKIIMLFMNDQEKMSKNLAKQFARKGMLIKKHKIAYVNDQPYIIAGKKFHGQYQYNHALIITKPKE